MFHIRKVSLVCLALLAALFWQCKKKSEPAPKPVVEEEKGDTCRISRTYMYDWNLYYDYRNGRVSKITVIIPGENHPHDLIYDANGRLTKVTGTHIDTSYEYDAKGRLIKENRNLRNDSFSTVAHYSARIFEYNEKDQVVKVSYVEGRGTDYNSFYIKKGEIYRYENYSYNDQGDVQTMDGYYREGKETTFSKTEQNVYQYDDQINPFYGHPGVYDFGMYFGADTGNGVINFSRHNIIKEQSYSGTALVGYNYTVTKYPSFSRNLPWQLSRSEEMYYEYVNCK